MCVCVCVCGVCVCVCVCVCLLVYMGKYNRNLRCFHIWMEESEQELERERGDSRDTRNQTWCEHIGLSTICIAFFILHWRKRKNSERKMLLMI